MEARGIVVAMLPFERSEAKRIDAFSTSRLPRPLIVLTPDRAERVGLVVRSGHPTGTAPRALAMLRNLAINTFRLARRANIAHARRDLHNHHDAFAVYNI
jgi:hypothetical protein